MGTNLGAPDGNLREIIIFHENTVGNTAAEARLMAETSDERRPYVSVIGLGAMGATLARTFARGGCDVTVWNRSAARAAPLAADGCRLAGSAAEAIAASPLTVLCVLNEAAVSDVLALEGVRDALTGKVVANVSTVAPEHVEAHADLVRSNSGTYLGGGILSYPRSIGSADAVIVYSGDRAAFERHADTLGVLAGGQRHVGNGDADAAVVYTASWVYYYGGLGGFLEAAAYAAAAGVDADAFHAVIPTVTRELAGGIGDAVRRIRSDDYSGEQGPIDGHVDGVGTFAATLGDAGVDAGICQAFVAHCRRAAEAGYGNQDIAALFKALGRS